MTVGTALASWWPWTGWSAALPDSGFLAAVPRFWFLLLAWAVLLPWRPWPRRAVAGAAGALALAAVPGSLLPQRGVAFDPGAVTRFLADNPVVGPWLDRLGFFEVYSSPWFSAIYLLLFASLIGCVIPRAKHHYKALRSLPPRTPARLSRLADYQETTIAADEAVPDPAGEAVRLAEHQLRRAGYRVQWKELRACDYGAPTSRKRLFLIARCDGQPIVWPRATHGKPGLPAVTSGQMLPWRTAAEIIDWSGLIEMTCPR